MHKQSAREDKIRQEIIALEYGRREQDIRAVLSTAAGKRFIWDIIGDCRVFHSRFHGNSRDIFEAGERNVGSKLLERVLEVDPKLMGQMAQSHSAKQKQIKEKVKELKDG